MLGHSVVLTHIKDDYFPNYKYPPQRKLAPRCYAIKWLKLDRIKQNKARKIQNTPTVKLANFIKTAGSRYSYSSNFFMADYCSFCQL